MIFQTSQAWKDLLKINKGLIPIKIVYFVYGLGSSMVYPYLSLQMFSIGMNYNEIAIIMGAVQAISFVGTPITGFIGDRIGYKIVLMVMLIAVSVSGTCLDFTPRFKEYIRTPTLQLFKAQSINEFDYVISSVSWPPACEGVNDTLATCQESAPVTDPNFWENITEYLDCSEEGPVGSNWTLDTNFDFDYVNVTEMAGNGTFCTAGSSSSEDVFTCSILNHPDVSSCRATTGSQAKTFWVYFAIRTVFQISMNSGYAVLDGTAMKLVDQHGGDYSYVLIWNLLAATIGPYLAGTLIPESTDPSVETDFSIAYYMMDGAMVIVFLVTFYLDVAMTKSEEKVSSALKNLFGNPAIITFLFMNLIMGIAWGAADAYLAIYLNEELGATYTLIGIGTSIALGAGIPILPVSKYIIRYFESLNIILAASVVTGLRLVLYAFITWSPPYHFLILSSFEILCLTLQWIACVHYIEKNCPITLVGTAVATIGATQNVLGRAVGNVVAGQLVTNADLTIPEMFNVIGISTCVVEITCYIFYRLVCKKYEKKLSDAKKEYQEKNSPPAANGQEQTKRSKSDAEFEMTLRNAIEISRL